MGSEATNLPLNDEVDFLGELWNGQGLGSTEETVIENPNLESASAGTASIGGKREHKLTERGKSYKLARDVRERKRLKRETQEQIANIQTLMELNRKLKKANTGLSSATRLADEHKDCTAVKNTLRNLQTCRESSPVEYTSSNKETGCEPKATFWERMELRLSQLPPEAPLLMATQLSAYGLEQISGTKLNVKNHCLTARD
ncbi:unnamed protein product [Porites lobata]|uniref:BZIP domain-containing protein n=1 Tax=Porites lobata TaxID=104759 RepID=A0ABN8S7N5_9CNID|nr:unnamed protein product [Porites lobata]